MATKPTEHELRTVADFQRVPKEKRAAMLTDFANWLDAMDELSDLLGDFIAAGQVKADHGVFRWIDDGKHDAFITLRPMTDADRVPEGQ